MDTGMVDACEINELPNHDQCATEQQLEIFPYFLNHKSLFMLAREATCSSVVYSWPPLARFIGPQFARGLI